MILSIFYRNNLFLKIPLIVYEYNLIYELTNIAKLSKSKKRIPYLERNK